MGKPGLGVSLRSKPSKKSDRGSLQALLFGGFSLGLGNTSGAPGPTSLLLSQQGGGQLVSALGIL